MIQVGRVPLTPWGTRPHLVTLSAPWRPGWGHPAPGKSDRGGDRTPDPPRVKGALSQLSYAAKMVAGAGFEPATSRL